MIASAFLIQLISFILGTAIVILSTTILTAYLGTFTQSADLPYQEFVRLGAEIASSVLKIIGVFLLPFIAIIHALVYLRARNASWESTKILLDQFKEEDLLPSK